MPEEREPSWPVQLVLAEQWAAELFRDAWRVVAASQDGQGEAVLLIAHGSHDLSVRAMGTCIAVALVVEFGPEVHDALAALPTPKQRRALQAVRSHLLQQQRTSFAIEPPGAVATAEVTRVAVEQVLRISRDDPSSFNRFADGLQEVAAAAAGALARLGAFVEEGANDRRGPRDPAPPGMYA